MFSSDGMKEVTLNKRKKYLANLKAYKAKIYIACLPDKRQLKKKKNESNRTYWLFV